MLYSLDWLQQGRPFPPRAEKGRIERYAQNRDLFNGDHFSSTMFRHRDDYGGTAIFDACARRISRVIGNFEDVVSFPVLLNYQRLISVKMSDLVCGEPPAITGASPESNDSIKVARDRTDFDNKLYATILDVSRYGDAIHRIYIDENDETTFTVWDPLEWYPIVSQDGTNRILTHCLCWAVNDEPDETKTPIWRLHVQIFNVATPERYTHRVYELDSRAGTIGKQIMSKDVPTGLDICAVQHIKPFSVSDSIYGYDDYTNIDSILSEIMARIGQISIILDKHADPNITGPVSMLTQDPTTGEYFLKTGKFFAVSEGEEQPKYMTWEGQLSSAFKELEILINQLYILTEMGSAILGDSSGGSQAISGTAMRFKMTGPLSKARRITNSLTLEVRKLISALCGDSVKFEEISIKWSDGLPDDPRENIELAKLATGESKLVPLKDALMMYFNKSNEEAETWVDVIRAETAEADESSEDANKPGPQDGTGINPQKKGSEMGLNNPTGQQNRSQDNNSKSSQASN